MHHALGVFVVPRCTGTEWFDTLYARALLRITVPVYREVGSEGQAHLESEAVALVAGFGYIGRVKAKRRMERDFTVYPIAALEKGGLTRVPAIAVLQTRCSPMQQAYMPMAAAWRLIFCLMQDRLWSRQE